MKSSLQSLQERISYYQRLSFLCQKAQVSFSLLSQKIAMRINTDNEKSVKDFKELHRSYLLRKRWKFNLSCLSELVAFDKRFFQQIINLETDKKRKSFLRERFRQIVQFEIWLDNYLESLYTLSEHENNL